jgi:hypothetical protein
VSIPTRCFIIHPENEKASTWLISNFDATRKK